MTAWVPSLYAVNVPSQPSETALLRGFRGRCHAVMACGQNRGEKQLMRDEKKFTLRLSSENAEAIARHAENLGMSINAYLTAAALERGAADDRDDRLWEQLNAMCDEQTAQFAEFRSELTEIVSAALAAEREAIAARINDGLSKFAQWAEKRWPMDLK